MKERPIIFNNEMVKAIIDGRKTQTRRIIKNSPKIPNIGAFYWFAKNAKKEDSIWNFCPYGNTGNHLWVRNNWYHYMTGASNKNNEQAWDEATNTVRWYAGGRIENCEPTLNSMWKKKPSIFMPRWASIITLKIKDIRIERLQDIAENDAKEEGAPFYQDFSKNSGYRAGFIMLWDQLNAKRGYPWDSNPRVWVIRFERVKP